MTTEIPKVRIDRGGDRLLVGVGGTLEMEPGAILRDNRNDLLVADATTERMFTLPDAGKHIEFSSDSAVTATIPTDVTVPFDVGTVIEIVQAGAGAVTIAAADGVTLKIKATATAVTAEQEAVCVIKKIAADVWRLTGELVLA